jgi:Growth inhibitor
MYMEDIRNIGTPPKIGEVYLMVFSSSGSEQGGKRPGVVFQNNVGNMYSPNIIALPLTSAVKKVAQPTHVLLRAEETGLRMDSIVLCENPERMSKERISRFITRLSNDYMKKIAEANLIATSAISFLDMESILRVWHAASLLNVAKV